MAQVAEVVSAGVAGRGGDVLPVAPIPVASAPISRITVDAAAREQRSRWARALIHIALLLGSVVTIFPFYWMVSTSFKDNSEAIASPPTFYPHAWHVENFAQAWTAAPFGRYFLNTSIVAVCSVGGVVVISSLAAYAFARMDFYGKNAVFAVILATMMVPSDLTLIPNFVIITKWLGWYNTYQAQFITAWGNVFAIFLLRQFFLGIPKELEEAAMIDGCSRFRFLWAILLPLSVPAIITVALINFLGAWNAFLWPLLVTRSPEMRPIQLGLIVFQTENGSQYAYLMAATTVVILPTVAVFLVAQKYFVEGIARTGLKG